MHQATESSGYTGKTHLRGFQILNLVLVRAGRLLWETLRERLYSRDFQSPGLGARYE
ncbi:MAG: hypothetical protein V7K62_18325 [Nostoc sp.]